MKIKKEELLRALSIIKPAISKKDIIEQATHFIFTKKEILAYNDKICIRCPYITDFQCSVRAEEFYKMINSIEASQINIEMKEGFFILQAGKTRSKLAISEEIEVPIYELEKKDKLWKDIPKEFREALNFCVFSTSEDFSDPCLTCCAIRGQYVFSSDGYRISAYKLSSSMEEVLIPAISAFELSKLDIHKYFLDDKWIHFKVENNIIFSSRIVKLNFPEVLGFFEFEDFRESIVFPEETKTIVEQILFMVEGDIVWEKMIDLIFSKNKLICRAEKKIGWIEKECKINYEGGDIKLKINPIFFMQILDKTSTMFLGDGKALFKAQGVFQHVMMLPQIN